MWSEKLRRSYVGIRDTKHGTNVCVDFTETSPINEDSGERRWVRP